ncbi:MAG: hypothetical protein AAFP90_04750, partial [Planctomycetota bacterium]
MWHTCIGDRTLGGREGALFAAGVEVMVGELTTLIDMPPEIGETAPQTNAEPATDESSCDNEYEQQLRDASEIAAFRALWSTDPADDSMIQDGMLEPYGIAVFDALQPSQQLGLLHRVAYYMLNDTPRTLPAAAVYEATVAAVFAEIRDQVAMETELQSPAKSHPSGSEDFDPDMASLRQSLDLGQGQDAFMWRHRVLSCIVETMETEDRFVEPGGPTPPMLNDPDLARWQFWIEAITDRVLWDRDYEMAAFFLDSPPDRAARHRGLMGIDEEYFSRIAPDPTPTEMGRIVTATREI